MMNFISFSSEGKEIILNSDRIISVTFDQGKAIVSCTDQVSIKCDESEDEIRRKLGVKHSEKTLGFGGKP